MYSWLKKVALAPLIIGLFLIPYSLLLANTGETEEVFYYLHDHLGGIEAVLDEDGNVVERRDYLPYGGIRSQLDLQPDLQPDSYGFTGKELDDETGLMYYDQRYYDAEIGRFVQIDPLVLGESSKPLKSVLTNPQALNSYSYVMNNPLKYVDPNGEWSVFAHLLFTSHAISMSNVDESWKKEHEEMITFGSGSYADIWVKFKGGKERDMSFHSTTPNDITNATDLKNRMLNNAKRLFENDSDLEFGRLLHMVQDSYGPSHVKRNKDGKIEAFYDFKKQDFTDHLKGDSIKNAELEQLTSAINATKKLIEFRSNRETKWSEVEKYLDKEVWALSNNATVGTAGEEYKDD